MNQNQWKELLDFSPKNYNGTEMTSGQFNILREMNMFNAFVFDQMFGTDYQVWVCQANLEALIKNNIIDYNDVALDLAFVVSYINRYNSVSTKEIGLFLGSLMKIYQPIVAPTKKFEYFDSLIANKIGEICDVYA